MEGEGWLNMINVSVILYSKTLTTDYHWIIKPDKVDNDFFDLLTQDYYVFDRNKKKYFLSGSEFQLHFKYMNNSCCFYKMLDTNKEDLSARKIYCLYGFCFKGISVDIILRMLPYFSFFFYQELRFNYDLIDDGDRSIKMEIDINEVISYCLKNLEDYERFFSKNKEAFKFKASTDSFYINKNYNKNLESYYKSDSDDYDKQIEKVLIREFNDAYCDEEESNKVLDSYKNESDGMEENKKKGRIKKIYLLLKDRIGSKKE